MNYTMLPASNNSDLRDISTVCHNIPPENIGFEKILGNETAKKLKDEHEAFKMLWGLNIFVLAVNITVVISSGLLLKRGRNICTYMFMGNIALADSVVGMIIFVGGFYFLFPEEYSRPLYKNNENNIVCITIVGTFVTTIQASIYGIFLITLDRFIYISYSMKYKLLMYPTRARLLILVAWIISFMIAVPPITIWKQCNRGEPVCAYILFAPPELIIFMNILALLILLSVCIIYSIILYIAIKKSIQMKKMMERNNQRLGNETSTELRYFKGGNNVRTTAPPNQSGQSDSVETDTTNTDGSNTKQSTVQRAGNKNNSPRKMKAIKVVVYTAGAFLVTWGPYLIATLVFAFCYHADGKPTCDESLYLSLGPLTVLGYFNSCLNPIIYAWLYGGFRNFIRKLFAQIIDKLHSAYESMIHSKCVCSD